MNKLPLSVKYTLQSVTHIPLIDGGGSCCENCGKLYFGSRTLNLGLALKVPVGLVMSCLKTHKVGIILLTPNIKT